MKKTLIERIQSKKNKRKLAFLVGYEFFANYSSDKVIIANE